MRAGNLIIKYSNLLLENKTHAILCSVMFSIVPFAAWLSVALVMLFTLRKGARTGFDLMLPAIIMHTVPLIMLVPLESAVINTLLAYFPCYTAALVLRKTSNWQMVFGIFFIEAFIGFSIIQLWAPELVLSQFNQFKNIVSEYKEYQLLVHRADALSSFVMAQLFLGIQILSFIISALMSLAFARSVQARLFKPGGFKDEILEFRSGKISFLVFMGSAIASYYDIPLAINILPAILCYFLLSGFNITYYIVGQKKSIKAFFILILLVLYKPSFVFSALVLLGSLDSLFNFRLYLPKQVREST